MSNKPRLVISDMYRARNKVALFAIHQALDKFKELDLEFHILWDDPEYKDEWTKKFSNLEKYIVSYSKEQLDDYCREWGISEETISDFKNFKSIYFVIHGHYLKSKNICNYYLIYDDDIILQDNLSELINCLKSKTPVLIKEPLNPGCDKVLLEKLIKLFGGKPAADYYLSINPKLLGFNAGFQGMSLDMYEDFLTKESFQLLLNLFYLKGIYDENGKEITGQLRTLIDTQQQSFFGVMNIIRSKTKPHILSEDYFTCPNWGTHPEYGDINTSNEYQGWDINLKSKVVHFIGHTQLDGKYYGKPKIFHDLVDKYLEKHSLL